MASGIDTFTKHFDFIFGRWVIEFTNAAAENFNKLFNALKIGGILAYESTDITDTGCFGFPDNVIPMLYHEIGKKVWQANHMEPDFIKRAYALLQSFGAVDIQLAANQAIMNTAEEKLPFRLAIEAAKETLIKHAIYTEVEYQEVLAQFKDFEESDNIAGFYRNILVSGKRL